MTKFGVRWNTVTWAAVSATTGNICTEDLVYLLHEMGIETGIDLEALTGIACDVEVAVGHALPGQLMKAGHRLDLHSMDSVRVAEG